MLNVTKTFLRCFISGTPDYDSRPEAGHRESEEQDEGHGELHRQPGRARHERHAQASPHSDRPLLVEQQMMTHASRNFL